MSRRDQQAPPRPRSLLVAERLGCPWTRARRVRRAPCPPTPSSLVTAAVARHSRRVTLSPYHLAAPQARPAPVHSQLHLRVLLRHEHPESLSASAYHAALGPASAYHAALVPSRRCGRDESHRCTAASMLKFSLVYHAERLRAASLGRGEGLVSART